MYSHNETSLLKSSQEISKQHIQNKTKETYIKHLVFSDSSAIEMCIQEVFTFDPDLISF
jgi:hypothetical protein